jgi:hypothetical protein
MTPCITASGVAYLVRDGSEALHVFGAHGEALPGVSMSDLGISKCTVAVCYDDESSTLILTDCSNIVALDMRSEGIPTKLWHNPGTQNCCGLAMLPQAIAQGQRGIVVAAANGASTLRMYALSDGALVASISTGFSPTYLSADPYTGMVYAAVKNSDLARFHWDDAAATLVEVDGPTFLPTAGDEIGQWASAVMPPAVGKVSSQLLVVARDHRQLYVYSLPDYSLIHQHLLDIYITGLASDPTGTSLILCGNSTAGCVRVIEWPLAGMPDLV